MRMMTRPDPHCRIARVTLKESGTIVHFPDSKKDRSARKIRADLRESVQKLGQTKHLSGYCMIIWTAEGYYRAGYSMSDDSPIKLTMLPGYISDAMRREIGIIDASNIIRGD